MMLLDQVAQRGFAIVSSVFEPDECSEILSDPSFTSFERSRAGARHLMSHPVAARLAHDPRMLKLAGVLLDAPAVPYRATLFEKTPSANWLVVWHQDTALPLCERFDSEGWGPWSTKGGVHYAHAPSWALEKVVALRLHLDASLSENGPLRVIPGSHVRGVLSDPEVQRLGTTSESSECLVPQAAGGSRVIEITIPRAAQGRSYRIRHHPPARPRNGSEGRLAAYSKDEFIRRFRRLTQMLRSTAISCLRKSA